VFHEPPRAVGHRRDSATAEVCWDVGYGLVEIEVGAAAPEEVEEVFAEGLVRIRSHRRVLGSVLRTGSVRSVDVTDARNAANSWESAIPTKVSFDAIPEKRLS
jgi:hypothetical protein